MSFLRRVAGLALRGRVRRSVSERSSKVGEVFRARPTGRSPPGRSRTCWRGYVSRLATPRDPSGKAEWRESLGFPAQAAAYLPYYFKYEMVYYELPSTLDRLIELATQIDLCIHTQKREHRGQSTGRNCARQSERTTTWKQMEQVNEG